VEGRASIAEALLASAKSAEVLSGLWDNIVVEGEVDAAGLLWWVCVSFDVTAGVGGGCGREG